MGAELTGILSGTGAKMKAEVMADHVVFRGAVKAEVPFEEIVAEARGTLLILSFQGNIVEVGAGARASQLASQIRSPPSRLDRMRVDYGQSAAVAGPLDPSFKGELGTRAVVAAGIPKEPVDILVFGAPTAAALDSLSKVLPLVGPTGTLWVVHPKPMQTQVTAAAKSLKLRCGDSVRFSKDEVATLLLRV